MNDEHGEKIMVKGQVKYCQPGIGMGVLFHNLTGEQKVKIKKLVERASGRSSLVPHSTHPSSL